MFIKKYIPRTLEESIRKDLLLEIIDVIKKKDKKKPHIVLFGQNGVGKTLAVYLIAKYLNYDVIELSSSDARDQNSLQEIIPSLKQKDLFGKDKIVLFDDIDALTQNDRGAISQIKKLMDITIFPFIFTANDVSKRDLSDIIKKSNLFEFNAFKSSEIYSVLTDISQNENVTIDLDLIQEISKRSNGDLRSAINDFETIIFSSDKSLLPLSRDLETKLKEAIIIILKSKDYNLLKKSLNNLDIDPNDLIYHIEENIFLEFEEISDLKKALEVISFANRIKSVILETQYYRLLVYYLFSLSVMIGLSKNKAYKKQANVCEHKLFLEMWIYQNKQKIAKDFSKIISKELEIPINSIYDNFIYLNEIIKNQNYLGLEELELLFSDKKK